MDIQQFSSASGNFEGESPGIYVVIVPQSKGVPQFVGSEVNITRKVFYVIDNRDSAYPIYLLWLDRRHHQ